MKQFKTFGVLFAGPFLFTLIYLIPSPFTNEQKLFLGIFSTTVYLWLFSNIPLYITGLLSVCSTIILKIGTAQEVFSHFAHPIIFLFLGGFLLAEAFNKVALDRRISLYLLTRDFIKGSITRLLFALMALTATFTMWISNTATTAMMLPLVLGVLSGLKVHDRKITSTILLCIAYSSSIGGIATPIGSTPNIIAIGMLDEFSNIKINFLDWMIKATPIAVIFLIILFLLAMIQFKNYHFNMDDEYLQKEYSELPKISLLEKYTLFSFFLTVFLWLAPSVFKLLNITINLQLNSGAVAVLGACLLFIFPFNSPIKILEPQTIKKIDWSSLLLFGSGLAIGKLLFTLGLATMAGKYLQEIVHGLPSIFVFMIIFTAVIFSTELTSNTATANIIIPIMISMASEMNMSPFYLSMGVAISCSMAFMLPVATPPNAIVYGSEKVDKLDMIKLGLGLNVIFSIVLSLIITLYSL